MLKDRQVYAGFWLLEDVTMGNHDVTIIAGAHTELSIFNIQLKASLAT